MRPTRRAFPWLVRSGFDKNKLAGDEKCEQDRGQTYGIFHKQVLVIG